MCTRQNGGSGSPIRGVTIPGPARRDAIVSRARTRAPKARYVVAWPFHQEEVNDSPHITIFTLFPQENRLRERERSAGCCIATRNIGQLAATQFIFVMFERAVPMRCPSHGHGGADTRQKNGRFHWREAPKFPARRRELLYSAQLVCDDTISRSGRFRKL